MWARLAAEHGTIVIHNLADLCDIVIDSSTSQ